MIEAAEERPWLWVVYILTVALPVFLLVLFCCSGKVGKREALSGSKNILCCFKAPVFLSSPPFVSLNPFPISIPLPSLLRT